MDHRLTPANARVAALHLKGRVNAPRYSEGAQKQLVVPQADLLRAPGGPRERQVLMGEALTVYDTHDGFAFVQAGRDGFVGYLPQETLGPPTRPTHWVAARSSHLYTAPDFKMAERASLSFGAILSIVAQEGDFARTRAGDHAPLQHLRPLANPMQDVAAVAEIFLGTPYLWGGNSATGIDCSGLVQAACLACAIACPRDSDQQESALGRALSGNETSQRGDVFFWRGHVGMMLDTETLIHANAHHMSVVAEPVAGAIARIAENEFGAVTSRRRPRG